MLAVGLLVGLPTTPHFIRYDVAGKATILTKVYYFGFVLLLLHCCITYGRGYEVDSGSLTYVYPCEVIGP